MTLPNKPKPLQPKNRMYECKLCHAECNSEFMYQQHVQGSKHKKKVTDYDSNINFTIHLMWMRITRYYIFIPLIKLKVRNMARIEDLKAGGDGTGKASSMAASILER